MSVCLPFFVQGPEICVEVYVYCFRRRKLYLRTYAVIPLNDECGLVEWVPDLSTFRSLCDGLYQVYFPQPI